MWQGSEAYLCGVKSFAAQYECTCSFMLFETRIFKTITVKEIEPNFIRRKVAHLKKYLQVGAISVANKHCKELFDLSVKALELAIKIIDEQGDQMGTCISTQLVMDDETISDPYSLKSDWTYPLILFWFNVLFFVEVKTFLVFGICRLSFRRFQHLSFGSVRLFVGFC